jgi:acyl-CoA synthetase (AMP-forming)/AMP-acid ligase II
MEGVAEAAAFGVPDDLLGEAVGAVVTLKAHAMLTAADILRHCAGQLEDFMRPRHVRIIDAMPKSPNGKVLKAAAAAMVLASAPRQGAA